MVRKNGLPGAARSEEMTPEMQAMLLMQRQSEPRIGAKELAKASELLTRYKQGKANLEERIVEDELWWELRHWEAIRKGRKKDGAIGPEPTSAWLFNSILNKHADAMDNYPEPIVLPRERSDEQSAKTLTSVLPVILECNAYERTYSDNWWEKLKHGTSVYGVFWNSEKESGLGDIDIRPIDLLKLFWEPGITDIQKSRNLFIVELVDEELLEQQYPEHKGKLGGSTIDVKQYIYDDTVDVSGKSVVVDWYYKVKNASGKSVLHYVKFVGDTLLFASENEPEYRERGWYDHGMYPVVLDVMFPEKGTPVGFGYVAICKDPQMYIDKLSANMLENALTVTKKRYFISESTAVNEDEFLDITKPLVHVAGELDERRLQEIVAQPLNNIYVSLLQTKIEEMKDTAGNRDVNSGGVGSGVTAASAIAALQEAGNKTSRDMISASYRAHTEVSLLCIELIRQFYDETRSFRIIGNTAGGYEFVDMNNADIRARQMGTGTDGVPLYRKPIFDLKIRAQKKNPFSRMEENERAKELYSLGFFNPSRAQETILALEMMDFEGIDKVREQVREGQTLLNAVNELSSQVAQLTGFIQSMTGVMPTAEKKAHEAHAREESPRSAPVEKPARGNVSGEIMKARVPMTDYGTRLAKRSTPDMESGG